jgi:hypothetical protein
VFTHAYVIYVYILNRIKLEKLCSQAHKHIQKKDT